MLPLAVKISDSSAVKICSIKAITVSKFVSCSKSFKTLKNNEHFETT